MEELLLIFVVVLVMCVIAFNDSSSLCVLLPVGGLFAYTMSAYSQKKNSSVSTPIENIVDDEPEQNNIQNMSEPMAIEPTDDYIATQNKKAMDDIYSDQKMNTIDHKVSKFNQRIGDRDRRAIITQIKGRRNPTMEPYYRQEMEDQGTVRWWDNEDVMVRMVNSNQMATIPH